MLARTQAYTKWNIENGIPQLDQNYVTNHFLNLNTENPNYSVFPGTALGYQ